MTALMIIILIITLLLVWVIWLTMRPMTVSFTFDDGLKAHLGIAAPLLEKYGWTGAFNVCTDFCETHPSTLTSEKLGTLSIDDNPLRRLDWKDVKTLLDRGHEVYPHTCSHANLEELDKSGKREEMMHEILDAKASYVSHLGVAPAFFCCPHLAWTPHVRDVIRTNGMEMFNNWRPDIGGSLQEDVSALLRRFWREGRRHIDLMFHGLVALEGGYNAFEDEAAFRRVLESIKESERTGRIRVVSYSSSHFGPSRFATFCDRLEWLLKKIRRVAFCLCMRGGSND